MSVSPQMTGEERFAYRSHVRGGLHFFILFMCSAMAAAAIFSWSVDSRPERDLIANLVVPLLVAAAAGGVTWYSTGVWTRQAVILRGEELEYRIGGKVTVVPFREVTRLTFLAVPGLGGRARLCRGNVCAPLFTNLQGIIDLLHGVRQRLEDLGLEHTYDRRRFDSFLGTAACCERRADRYRRRYRAFPWLAVLAPTLVLGVSNLIAMPPGLRFLWAAVFAVYPWLVVGFIEMVLLARFFDDVEKSGSAVPPRDPDYEVKIIRRFVVAGYYGYLGLNLMVLLRLA